MNFNWRKINTIFRSEMRCVLRDRVTLITMIILPIITYPMIAMVISWMMLHSFNKIENSTSTVVLRNATSEYTQAISSIKNIKIRTDEVNLAELKKGKVDLIVEFSATFSTELQKLSGSSEVTLYYDNAEFQSKSIKRKVSDKLQKIRNEMKSLILTERNLPAGVNNPFIIYSKNIATSKKMGGFLLGQIIPYLLIIFAAIGAFYPAIDVTAMEKEKGTLETILVTPTSTFDLLAGKFLSVFLLAFFSIFLNIGSIALTTSHGLYMINGALSGMGSLPEFSLSISPWVFIIMLTIMIPMAAIFSSLMMIVAIFARNFKEAQNYMTPLLLIFSAPPMVGFFPGFELNTTLSLIPIFNITLLFRDMMLGKFVPLYFLLTILSIIFTAFLCLLLAVKVFNSEKILFRSSEDLSSLLPTVNSVKHAVTVIPLAWLLVLFVITMMYYVGGMLQAINIHWGLLASEILLVFLPAWFFIRRMRWDFKNKIGLKIPRPANLLRLTVLAFSGMWIASLIGNISNQFLPPPPDFLLKLMENFRWHTPDEMIFYFILVAVLPALCEEVLFRGAVFNAMRMKHSLQTSALIAAALFSITHLDPYRLFSVFFIGWYLALAYEYTQTLLAPILIHFLNNGFALVTLNLIADITELETPSLSTSLLIALLSFPFFYFSLEGLRKQWQNSVEKKEEIIQPAEQ